jgi:hypothetical protein
MVTVKKILACYDQTCKKRGSKFQPCKVFNKKGVSTCEDGLTCFITKVYGSEMPQCKPPSSEGGKCLKQYHCDNGLLCNLNLEDANYQKCVSPSSTKDTAQKEAVANEPVATEAIATEADTKEPPTTIPDANGEEALEEDFLK